MEYLVLKRGCSMSIKRLSAIVLCALALWNCGASRAAGAEKQVLMVIPARYTIVQFAFDVARLRSVSLVAYEAGTDSSSPVMHVWDQDIKEWVRTSVGEYSSGALFRATPDVTVLVGTAGIMPGIILETSRSASVREVPDLNIAQLVNTLNTEVSFTPAEWRYLAGRYGLQLKDENAQRRRWGRYGPPGTKARKPAPRRAPQEASVKLPPPAEVFEPAPAEPMILMEPAIVPEPEVDESAMDAPAPAAVVLEMDEPLFEEDQPENK